MGNIKLKQNFSFQGEEKDFFFKKTKEFFKTFQAFLLEIKIKLPQFFKILDNRKQQKEIISFAQKNKNKFNYFIVCGIGGSALGVKVITEGLQKENIKVLDSIDPFFLKKFTQDLSKKNLSKILFFFVSKSGNTLETLSQFFFFRDFLEKNKINWKKNFIFITGSKGTLIDIASKHKIKTFSIPLSLTGRFSVFSAVGLLPLACSGVNIEKLLQGAKKGLLSSLSENLSENKAFLLAFAEFFCKKPISVSFIYSYKLRNLGNYWRQLLAESIGKSNKIGITPLVAIGTREQHSDLQLFIDGPTDKLFTFLIENKKSTLKPSSKELGIFKKSFSDLIEASFKGTARSLMDKGLPVQSMEINSINEESLGEILFIFQAEIFFLAKILKINPFNQPGVEKGKKITKKLLVS